VTPRDILALAVIWLAVSLLITFRAYDPRREFGALEMLAMSLFVVTPTLMGIAWAIIWAVNSVAVSQMIPSGNIQLR